MTSQRARSLYESRWSSESGRGLPTTGRSLVRRAPNTKDPNLYYLYLGVAPWATQREITRAYRSLVKKCHPDSPSPDPEEFRRLSVIYQTLSDEELRREYNATPEGQLFVDELVKELVGEELQGVEEDPIPRVSTRRRDFYDYASIEVREGDCEDAQEWYQLLLLALRHTDFRRPFKVCLVDSEDSMGYTRRPDTFWVHRGLDRESKISVAWSLGQVSSTTCLS